MFSEMTSGDLFKSAKPCSRKSPPSMRPLGSKSHVGEADAILERKGASPTGHWGTAHAI